MKKGISQLTLGLVCLLLGFLIVYQFKFLDKNAGYNSSDIVKEVQLLNEEKDKLSKEQAELSEELKQYEDDAADETLLGQKVKNELNNARIQLGLVAVEGPGVEFTLTKKNSFLSGNFSDDFQVLTDQDIVKVINLIWLSKAEAIEINDYRITPQIGIKNSGNYITIGTAGKINPSEKIVIKAIGDSAEIKKTLNFKADMEVGAFKYYDKSVVEKDNIVINKTTESMNSSNLSPVQ